MAFPLLMEQFFIENIFNEHTRELCNCIDVLISQYRQSVNFSDHQGNNVTDLVG